MIVQYFLITVGQSATKILTAILSISLAILNTPKFEIVLNFSFHFVFLGFTIPLVMFAANFYFNTDHILSTTRVNPNFQFGTSNDIISMSCSFICLIVTVYGLILHYRFQKKYIDYLEIKDVNSYNDTNDENIINYRRTIWMAPSSSHEHEGDEDVLIRNRKAVVSQENRNSLVLTYREENHENLSPLELDETKDVFANVKHKVVLICLSMSILMVSQKPFLIKSCYGR